jgi:hypothetical protein
MPQERWQPSGRESRYKRRRERLPRLFSQGDSWFDYPPHPNIIDYIDDSERWAIKRFERSGEWLKEMIPSLPRVVTALEQEKPLCMLLSGGGNDVADKNVASTLFKQFQQGLGAPELINRLAWDAKLDDIEAGFLFYMDAVNEFVPLIVHGYDYLVPSPKGAKYDGFRISGPWVQPVMQDCGITDKSLQRDLGRLTHGGGPSSSGTACQSTRDSNSASADGRSPTPAYTASTRAWKRGCHSMAPTSTWRRRNCAIGVISATTASLGLAQA